MIFLKEELSGEINKKIWKEALYQRQMSMVQGFCDNCKIIIDFLVYIVLYYMSTFLGISLPFGLRVAQRAKEECEKSCRDKRQSNG